MLDRIITEFANDPNLGLVYPDDPYLNSWEENRLVAAELAQRIGISVPQVTHFDYPVGGMFWARPQALQPLIAAGIGWDEYPPEPLPHDGTMLHALERLIPFIVEQSGYTIAKTRVPGVNR
jgi:lipopolysaccharide biosynthesis protein